MATLGSSGPLQAAPSPFAKARQRHLEAASARCAIRAALLPALRPGHDEKDEQESSMKNPSLVHAAQSSRVEAGSRGATAGRHGAGSEALAIARAGAAIAALGLALADLTACSQGGSPSYSLLPSTSNFSQASSTTNNKVDVLWIVDNSSSMDPLQQNLTSNFSTFMTNFEGKGFDFQMATTTTDAYLADPNFDNNPQLAKFRDGVSGGSLTGYYLVTPNTPNLLETFITNATQGANGSGDERAFQSMQVALASSLNSGFPRPGAFFAVVILSDEDDFTDYTRPEGSWVFGGIPDHDYANPNMPTVDSVVAGLDALTGSTAANRHYNVSAITVLDNTCLATHQAASPSSIVGQRYIDIANQTAGVLGSVCDASYANSLNFIQQQIVELSTAFPLNRLPVVSSIQVYVNGALAPEGATNGWTYNATANTIVFHGTAVPPANAAIQVAFTPTTIE
jgi:cytochrome c551/c552